MLNYFQIDEMFLACTSGIITKQ